MQSYIRNSIPKGSITELHVWANNSTSISKLLTKRMLLLGSSTLTGRKTQFVTRSIVLKIRTFVLIALAITFGGTGWSFSSRFLASLLLYSVDRSIKKEGGAFGLPLIHWLPHHSRTSLQTMKKDDPKNNSTGLQLFRCYSTPDRMLALLSESSILGKYRI